MLQQFKFENQIDGVQPEISARDFHNGSAANVGPDQWFDPCYALPID